MTSHPLGEQVDNRVMPAVGGRWGLGSRTRRWCVWAAAAVLEGCPVFLVKLGKCLIRVARSSDPRGVLTEAVGHTCEDVPCSCVGGEGELSQPRCLSPREGRGQVWWVRLQGSAQR